MAAKLLDLKRVMRAIDKKDYDFYDNLTPEDKKLFSPYLSLRWMASVTGNEDLQSYYLLSTNERVNKNFWSISKHHKLCWLCMVAAAPGVGEQFHYWLTAKKKEGSSKKKVRDELLKAFPTLKESDIDLMLLTNTEQDIAEWLNQQGLEDKEVKAILK
jgi:hypothetical protein